MYPNKFGFISAELSLYTSFKKLLYRGMKAQRKYKVRFHLAPGENFMKWQVKDAEGNVSFYEPSEVSLKLCNCFLRNQPTTAKKIHDGANKTVCAWVECESVEVVRSVKFKNGFHLAYNPRVMPNWFLNNEKSKLHGKNLDGKEFREVLSSNRRLYLV